MSWDKPPTADCPGCCQAVEIEHEAHRTLDGRSLYVPIQSEHDALLAHMDQCPHVASRGGES